MVSEVTEPDQPAGVVDHDQNHCFPAEQHVKFERNKSRLQRKKRKRGENTAGSCSSSVPQTRDTFFFSLATVEKCKINSRTKLDLVNILSKCPHIHSKKQYQHNLKGHSTLPHWEETLLVLFITFFFLLFIFFNPTYTCCSDE